MTTSPFAASGTAADDLAEAIRFLPHDAGFCGLTAGRMQGLWLPPWAGARPTEVGVPGRGGPARLRHHSRLVGIRHRRRLFRPDELTVVDGLPVTTLARTWVDLAEDLDLFDLVAAGDSALRAGLEMAEIATVLDRAHHRRGVRRARAALPLLDARSRSRPESWLRVECRWYGLPPPEVNRAVTIGGEWIGEPDLHWKEARLALEYQGEDHAGVERMRRDITRGLSFSEVDWLVLPAGPAQVFTHPDRFLRQVVFEYVRRGGQLPPRSSGADLIEWRDIPVDLRAT